MAIKSSEKPAYNTTSLDGIPALIRQRRAQMLVHSCIYYEMNDNIVSDDLWQAWADELEDLQKNHPEHTKIGFFDEVFLDWDGSTGSHLPHRHPWVYQKASYILELHTGGSDHGRV